VTPGLKRRVRNTLVLAGGAVSALGSAATGKRALAFHDVPDVAAFRRLLDRLQADYDILPLQDWLTTPRTNRTQLTLTFDDGYAQWHEAVAPLLERRRLPAVFFVSSGLVGLQGEEARAFARNRLRRTRELSFIGVRELEDLARHDLFEVGGHTATHADLGQLVDQDSVHLEVVEDRARLEDWVGGPVRWFAYPFGAPGNVSSKARSVVEKAGMSAAFTLIPGWWDPTSGDRFLIARDGLDPSLPLSVSRAWLSGGYDRLYTLKTSIAGRAGLRSRATSECPGRRYVSRHAHRQPPTSRSG
jgi:peptidoglycan/xylan/chitin deacetylase (PgdA/CDA1 family)